MNNEMIEKYFENPSNENYQNAVMSMTNFVRSIAIKFRNPSNTHFDDIMQNGYIGVIKALKTYNKNKGRFTTHCYFAVFSEICQYINLITGSMVFLNKNKNYFFKILFHINNFNFDISEITHSQCIQVAKELNIKLKYVMQFISNYRNIYIPDNFDTKTDFNIDTLNDILDIDKLLKDTTIKVREQLFLYVQGESLNDIGEKTHTKRKTVQYRILNIVNKLKVAS